MHYQLSLFNCLSFSVALSLPLLCSCHCVHPHPQVERVLEPSQFVAPGRGDALPPPDPRLVLNSMGQVPYQVRVRALAVLQGSTYQATCLLCPGLPLSFTCICNTA